MDPSESMNRQNKQKHELIIPFAEAEEADDGGLRIHPPTISSHLAVWSICMHPMTTKASYITLQRPDPSPHHHASPLASKHPPQKDPRRSPQIRRRRCPLPGCLPLRLVLLPPH